MNIKNESTGKSSGKNEWKMKYGNAGTFRLINKTKIQSEYGRKNKSKQNSKHKRKSETKRNIKPKTQLANSFKRLNSSKENETKEERKEKCFQFCSFFL